MKNHCYVNPKTIYNEYDRITSQERPDFSLLNEFALARGSKHNPNNKVVAYHKPDMQYGDNLAGMRLNILGDNKNNTPGQNIIKTDFSKFGKAHSEPLVALNTVNAMNPKYFQNVQREGLYQPKDTLRYKTHPKNSLMYNPSQPIGLYEILQPNKQDEDKREQLKYLFNNAPNFGNLFNKLGAEMEIISERPFCGPDNHDCQGFINDFAPDNFKGFHTSDLKNMATPVVGPATDLLSSYNNYFNSEQEEEKKQEEDPLRGMIVSKSNKNPLQHKPSPLLELEKQVLSSIASSDVQPRSIFNYNNEQKQKLARLRTENSNFFEKYGDAFEKRQEQFPKVADYLNALQAQAKFFQRDEAEYKFPSWLSTKEQPQQMGPQQPIMPTVSQQMSQPIVNSFSLQEARDRIPSPKWSNAQEKQYYVANNLNNVPGSLQNERETYSTHQIQKGNLDPFKDFNPHFSRGGYVNSNSQRAIEQLEPLRDKYNRYLANKNQTEGYARGGRVAAPSRRRSNFDMQRAIQILELLTRGMA